VPAAMSELRAVTFDFWNTLVSENAGGDTRLAAWLGSLTSHGHRVEQATLERTMTDLWGWFNARWEGNEVVGPEELAGQTLAFLDVEPAPALLEEMVASLHDGHDPETMQVSPGIGDALEGLRSAGLRVGIICDVGFTPSTTLRRYLDHHGLLGHFDGWSFSDEVGCYKPDRRIFAHAAGSLDLPDDTAFAHVGDLRRTDIAGARGAGWTSVRYAGWYDDQSDLPDADVTISDHADLTAALGID